MCSYQRSRVKYNGGHPTHSHCCPLQCQDNHSHSNNRFSVLDSKLWFETINNRVHLLHSYYWKVIWVLQVAWRPHWCRSHESRKKSPDTCCKMVGIRKGYSTIQTRSKHSVCEWDRHFGLQLLEGEGLSSSLHNHEVPGSTPQCGVFGKNTTLDLFGSSLPSELG